MTETEYTTETDEARRMADSFAHAAARYDHEPATQWVAGWNMPGYLPVTDPELFESWEDARDYLADELRRVADGLLIVAGDEEGYDRELIEDRAHDADQLAHGLHDHEADTPIAVGHEDMVYWAQPTGQGAMF